MTNKALLLTGGGARAAYQIGVIKAIDDIAKKQKNNIFNIFSGVSAGAINSVYLSAECDNWSSSIDNLLSLWQNIEVEQIYKTDSFSVLKTAMPWIKTLIPFTKKDLTATGEMFLLDNSPLIDLFKKINFDNIDKRIEEENLLASCVTCSSYHSGQSVTFFQSKDILKQWNKERRIGIKTKISAEHLLASSALPIIFPAQKIKSEYFGDGSMRQVAPLSPAVHLGADKIFVIGTGKNNQFQNQSLLSEQISLNIKEKKHPTIAQIGGHVLNGLFLDNLYADIERLERTNDLLDKFKLQDGVNLKKIDLFIINPSRKIDEIASSFVKELPDNILKLLKRIGATEKLGGGLASYLLFEKSYANELIELGYEDAWMQKDEILRFIS